MRRRDRGLALIMTLGFTAIIVMMLTATMTSSHGGNIFSQDYHRKAAAMYAAESGLAMVQEALENDPDWRVGFVERATPFGTGRYTVRFTPSVNNLTGLTPVSGPYGPVAPQTAFLRIEGHSMGRTEVIECIIGRRSEDFVHVGLIATGKIYLGGDVSISGQVSSDDLTITEADLVSNYDRDAPWGDSVQPVFWDGSSTPGVAENEVAGTIRSASPSELAISSNLRDIADQSLTDQSPVSVKNVNIQRSINEKSGVSRSVPPVPAGPLSGEYYQSSSISVAGDLVLDNASLYIDGDLNVAGSIEGAGAIYVAGNTRFSGNAEVRANEDGVVLYSQGNVHLRGFSGMEWMDTVADYRGRRAQWEDTKTNIELLQGYLNAFAHGDDSALMAPPETPGPGDGASSFYWGSKAGVALANLAFPLLEDYRPPGVSHNDLLVQMVNLIKAEPPGRTRDFMLEKFLILRSTHLDDPDNSEASQEGVLGINRGTMGAADIVSILEDGAPVSTGLQTQLFLWAAHLNGEVMGPPRFGTFAGLTIADLRRALIKQAHWLNLYGYDSLGSSYFQGSVYTRGAIYASNEVTIIGSLSAVRDPDRPDTSWVPDTGSGDETRALKPGDVYLGNGTKILHVERLGPGLRFSTPPVGVSHWLR